MIGEGVLMEADVRTAQAILDQLTELADNNDGDLPMGEARGVLAAWSADVRTAGYLEGMQRGRQEAAHVVLDALRGEGLAP